MDHSQTMPLLSLITFYRPHPLFSPVPVYCLPLSLYLLPFRVSMPHFQQQGMCVYVCYCVFVFCLVFADACIVLRTLMLVAFGNFVGVMMCTHTWAGFLTNSWSLSGSV